MGSMQGCIEVSFHSNLMPRFRGTTINERQRHKGQQGNRLEDGV